MPDTYTAPSGVLCCRVCNGKVGHGWTLCGPDRQLYAKTGGTDGWRPCWKCAPAKLAEWERKYLR